MNHRIRLKELLQKLEDGGISAQELADLESLVSNDPEFEATELIRSYLDKQTARSAAPGNENPDYWTKITEAVMAADNRRIKEPAANQSILRFFPSVWLRVAAMILILAGGVYLWQLYNTSSQPAQQPIAKEKPISPASHKAILTLEDGSTIVLDSDSIKTIQHGPTTVSLQNGELIYSGMKEGESPVYNTLTTPRGGQFAVQLPDGTKVWLNAASTLRYPTAFTNRERMVYVSGEAYFDVAPNPAMPFKVNISDRAEVMVLGTQFNVNSYANTNTLNTTLIEGAVQFYEKNRPDNARVLKPGEQAGWEDGRIYVTNKVDLNKVVAWKNGLFNFDGASLDDVMKEVERWYDIEIVYEGSQIPEFKFFGELSRDLTLQGLINALKDSGVRFRIENRTLIVLK